MGQIGCPTHALAVTGGLEEREAAQRAAGHGRHAAERGDVRVGGRECEEIDTDAGFDGLGRKVLVERVLRRVQRTLLLGLRDECRRTKAERKRERERERERESERERDGERKQETKRSGL